MRVSRGKGARFVWPRSSHTHTQSAASSSRLACACVLSSLSLSLSVCASAPGEPRLDLIRLARPALSPSDATETGLRGGVLAPAPAPPPPRPGGLDHAGEPITVLSPTDERLGAGPMYALAICDKLYPEIHKRWDWGPVGARAPS